MKQKQSQKTQNIAVLYTMTKTLAGGFRNSEVPVKDVNGNVITGIAKQANIRKSHFETILSKEAPNNLADNPVSDEGLKVTIDPPSAEEVRKAVSSMKSGKAPGADGVSADMLKTRGEIIVRTMIENFEGIWEKEEIPNDCKTKLIVKLPKKGDLTLCNNWIGITLLSVTGTVFNRVILDIISAAIDPPIRKNRPVFRKEDLVGTISLHCG